jgi:uncharacterized protein (TIGR03083 family)
VEFEDHLAAFRRDLEVMVTLADGRLARPVPSCPGWTVADLLRHLGMLHWWAAEIAAQPEIQPVHRRDAPPAADDAQLVAWYQGRGEALLAALATAGPDKPCWTFLGPDVTRFWARRQAHELSVHRWDLELAATGEPAPIDAPLAADGIDEYLAVFVVVRGVPDDRNGATIHLHCTDVAGEWLVRLVGGHAEVTHEHAKGDVAVRGEASDLVLSLWRRRPIEALEVFGDGELFEAFVERVGI